MERIGIAASKIAKGNFFLYNLFVILISALFSLLVFLISGSAIVVALIIVAYVSSGNTFPDLEKRWMSVMTFCMACLAVVIRFFALCAIIKNIKFKKNK